jgi:predicted acylesterase/phospholipase RssA
LNPVRFLSVILLGVALAACSGASVDSLRDPVPEPLVTQSSVPGYKRIRYWGDDGDGLSPDIVAEIEAQQKVAGITSRERNFLAVSGGGSNGAFGAGLLFGWTASGNRPEFSVVTGVSTGSLIAPFAFLGPLYDDFLKEAYTQVSAEDIFEKKGILRVLRGSASVADSAPLRRLVARYVTDQMLADIEREHKRGRRLLVGTTNLDAERPVVWDIGAIASSGVAGRKQLIQDILVASASIPGLFPPVKIKVVADGMTFDEMHVDGGTSNQAFMFPSNFSVRQNDKKLNRAGMDRTLYVVRNGKVTPEFSKVKPRLAAIVSKSMNSLIKTQGIGDLYRMYSNSRREGIAFRAVWIPESFTMREPQPFDPDFMRALFDLGYEMGRKGIPWVEHPP